MNEIKNGEIIKRKSEWERVKKEEEIKKEEERKRKNERKWDIRMHSTSGGNWQYLVTMVSGFCFFSPVMGLNPPIFPLRAPISFGEDLTNISLASLDSRSLNLYHNITLQLAWLMKEFKEGIIYFKLYSFHGVYEKERIFTRE